jgi:ufm1-conjugating enzyme 1
MEQNISASLESLPFIKTNAGPKDGEQWIERLKEEYMLLIQYIQMNKDDDHDWFNVESNADGTKWHGKCWYIHNFVRYEFDL